MIPVTGYADQIEIVKFAREEQADMIIAPYPTGDKSAADSDRQAAEADQPETALLPEQRDALKEKADRDAEAVKRERDNSTAPGGAQRD